jgi:hypothetical protein
VKITLIVPRVALRKTDVLSSPPVWPVEFAVFAAFLQNRGDEVSVLDLFGSAPTQWEDRGTYFLQGVPFGRRLKTEAIQQAELAVIYAGCRGSLAEVVSIAKVLGRVRPDLRVGVLENTQSPDAHSLEALQKTFGGETDTPFFVSLRHGNSEDFPIPAWDLFPIDNYGKLPSIRGPRRQAYLPLLTSYQFGDLWIGRRANVVVDEICLLRDRWGVRHFRIDDLNPTQEKGRWEKICERLVEKNAEIHFYFAQALKADSISLEEVSLFRKAGCRFLPLSTDPIGESVVALERACHQLGIDTYPFRLPKGFLSLIWLLVKARWAHLTR